jgi:hypothetical protein
MSSLSAKIDTLASLIVLINRKVDILVEAALLATAPADPSASQGPSAAELDVQAAAAHLGDLEVSLNALSDKADKAISQLPPAAVAPFDPLTNPAPLGVLSAKTPADLGGVSAAAPLGSNVGPASPPVLTIVPTAVPALPPAFDPNQPL